jgi:NADH:ubiquinone oxidoreductase subunit F (NADH-binding)
VSTTSTESAILTGSGRVGTLDDYRKVGGGEALDIALTRGPEKVIEELSLAGLRGRGGAGFPTGVKWRAVRTEPGERRFAVCNGAEGEPGTFKDRWLLDLNPYQVVEGLQIAAFAVGAERAYIGIKSSFAPQIDRLSKAMLEMDDAGLLIVPTEVVLGPDEYLFGEEKALMEVIEGNPPLPRILPPYQHGLFQGGTSSSRAAIVNPTLANNVETLANVPHIMRRGATWFRSFGTEGSPGTMVFTVSGDVQAGGVYELPLGTPLRTLLEDIAGARAAKVVFPGAASTIIVPAMFDAALDFDVMREAGTGLGSGGFIVYDESTCIVEVTLLFSRFLGIESCGQCPACKTGTGAITEALYRIQSGSGSQEDVELALDRSLSVTDAARCALPTGENRIIQSAIRTFTDEFTAHVGRACPSPRSLTLPKLTAYDPKAGTFTFDDRYARKRPSWTYAPEGEPVWPAGHPWERS